jgi:dolichyl-phosphate mannosyltransferase polypeptide 3
LSPWYVSHFLPFLPGNNRLTLTTTLQLPFWFLVSFGAWLLFRLGWGMVTFRDTPDAYAELMDEIKLAKADLRTKGVDVD